MSNAETKSWALITGGAKRLGKAMAEELHKQGYGIVIQYRNSSHDAEELCDSMNARCPNSAFSFQCDLSQSSELDQLIKFVNQNASKLSLLVNNASSFYPTPVADSNEIQWLDLMDTNLKAPYFLSKGLYPLLAKNGGNIVNMVDIYGERPLKEHTIYSISKAGLIMLTQSLAVEFGPEVRVNGIAPGAILWPNEGQDNIQEILDKTALKKQGSPADICKALTFINDSPYLSGTITPIDAGRRLYI